MDEETIGQDTRTIDRAAARISEKLVASINRKLGTDGDERANTLRGVASAMPHGFLQQAFKAQTLVQKSCPKGMDEDALIMAVAEHLFDEANAS